MLGMHHNNFVKQWVAIHRSKLLVTACLCWLVAMVILADRTGAVIVDGFQSIGAVAASDIPGDLHWPMLGNFLGYDQVWGFHWIGWPLLRSLFLPLVSWNPVTDFALLSSAWLATAVFLGKTIKRSTDGNFAFGAASLSLLSPGFLVALQSYRPEIITSLLLMLYLYGRDMQILGRNFIPRIIFLLLPLFHPLGVVVPVSWIAADFLWQLRRSGWKQAIRGSIGPSCFLAMGTLSMVGWFLWQPQAWDQFLLNIRTQRLLTEGLGPGYWQVMRWGYGFKSALPLVLLLVIAIWGGILALRHQWQNHRSDSMIHPQTLAAIGFITAVAFNLVVKNPNTNHMLAVAPLAAWLFCLAWNSPFRNQAPSLRTTGLVLFVFLWNLHTLKNLHLLVKLSGASYREELRNILVSTPSSCRVLIPVAFWEAALLQSKTSNTDYRFSTFPNILEAELRSEYESKLESNLEPDDILIWDPQQETGGIFNFVKATALEHSIICPPAQPDVWEKVKDIHIATQYSRSQSINFVIYRKK